jgi:uncharacterized protein (DUF2252 family)
MAQIVRSAGSDDIPGQADTSAQRQRAEGKEQRRRCPRSSHGGEQGVRYDREAVELVIASNEDRLPDLVPIRHARMLESPFAFFRGSAVVQAHDLASTPRSGIRVQACGDCHLLNFGGFATPERNLIFDINDFDETLAGPWEWDVKRLATSLILAARWRNFPKSCASEAVTAAVARYREVMAKCEAMPTLETWYAEITFADLYKQLRSEPKLLTRLTRAIERAPHNTAEHVFHKLTSTSDGAPRIVDHPPLLYHPPDESVATEAASLLKRYPASLRDEYRALLARFELVDIAIKVVGVGSVGTRCYVVLLLGSHGDPLFLQVKEARQSVLEQFAGPSRWRNQGHRVVSGQRMMQGVSDIFLGWSRGPRGRDYYVRQLRDMKLAADLTVFDAETLVLYARLCGRTLARAHAKGGEAPRIAGYLGSSSAFDDAITRYALAYADQVERDYQAFQAAARNGRIPVDSSPPMTSANRAQ